MKSQNLISRSFWLLLLMLSLATFQTQAAGCNTPS
jgi:hypothetical protein